MATNAEKMIQLAYLLLKEALKEYSVYYTEYKCYGY